MLMLQWKHETIIKKTSFIKCQCIENELRSIKDTVVTLILSPAEDGMAIPKRSLKQLLRQAICRQRVEHSLVFSRTVVTGFTPGIKPTTFCSYQLSQPYHGQN